MNILLRYYSLNKLQLFVGMVIANLLLIFISKSVLINEIVFYNTYSDQLTYDRSIKLFENMKNLAWISYAFTPVVLLIKFSLVSLVLYSGVVLYNLQSKISLGSIFKVVIASEIVFVLASLTKFLWFSVFAGNYDLNDLAFFFPLSLINFFKISEVARIWVFPLQTINLFNLAYIILLAYGLNRVCNIEKAESEKIVLFSYLPGLLIWVALVLFLTLDTTI